MAAPRATPAIHARAVIRDPDVIHAMAAMVALHVIHAMDARHATHTRHVNHARDAIRGMPRAAATMRSAVVSAAAVVMEGVHPPVVPWTMMATTNARARAVAAPIAAACAVTTPRQARAADRVPATVPCHAARVAVGATMPGTRQRAAARAGARMARHRVPDAARRQSPMRAARVVGCGTAKTWRPVVGVVAARR
jgi:cell envelope opacity-associated protein A